MTNALFAKHLTDAMLNEKYPGYEWRLASNLRLPLQFPDGWRCPYEPHSEAFRVCKSLVTCFVPEGGKPQIEWNDIANKEEIDPQLARRLSLPQPNVALKAIEDANRRANLNFPHHFESMEVVWDFEPKPVILWRVGYRLGMRRYVQTVSLPEGTEIPVLGRREEKSTCPPLRMREIEAENEREGPPDHGEAEAAHALKLYNAITNRISQTADFLSDLGYTGVRPDFLRVELVDSKLDLPGGGVQDFGGAAASYPNGVPTVTFFTQDGWATDPSIVLHELGHAIWYLLFTRPPNGAGKDGNFNNIQKGIEEGFADYFAATQLYTHKPIRIGGKVLEPTDDPAFPRKIEAKSFRVDDPEDAYQFAQQWSHLLWNLREEIGNATKANGIILDAHFRPAVRDNPASPDPREWYFQALVESAGRKKIKFTKWDELKKDHLAA